MAEPPCSGPDCDRPIGAHGGRGLCAQHLMQLNKGKPLLPIPHRKIRPLLPNADLPGTLLVPLTKGYFAIIDEADGPLVGTRNWAAKVSSAARTVYAGSNNSRKSVGATRRMSLHRFLWASWGLPDAPEIDHRNTNGLDCRRENLRAATHRQNATNREKPRHNTTGVRGVHWAKNIRKWFARVKVDGVIQDSEYFDNRADAVKARIAMAQLHYGDFAGPADGDEKGEG